jgi:hypothetical protein
MMSEAFGFAVCYAFGFAVHVALCLVSLLLGCCVVYVVPYMVL